MSSRRLPNATRTALEEGPDTPAWWPMVQIALLVAFAGYVLWSLGGSGDPAPGEGDPVADAPPPAVVAEEPSGAAGDPDGTGAGTGAGDAAQTVAVDDGAGGTVPVDEAALAQGRAYARALFTTDFSEVEFLPGISAPELPTSYEDPQVGEPRVLDAAEGQVRLSFPVDPDGEGSQALRDVSVTVLLVDGSWVVRGA